MLKQHPLQSRYWDASSPLHVKLLLQPPFVSSRIGWECWRRASAYVTRRMRRMPCFPWDMMECSLCRQRLNLCNLLVYSEALSIHTPPLCCYHSNALHIIFRASATFLRRLLWNYVNRMQSSLCRWWGFSSDSSYNVCPVQVRRYFFDSLK